MGRFPGHRSEIFHITEINEGVRHISLYVIITLSKGMCVCPYTEIENLYMDIYIYMLYILKS